MDINGTITNSTVKKPYISKFKTLIGLNINQILPKEIAKSCHKKIQQVINSDICKSMSYDVAGHKMLAIITKLNKHSVILHQAEISPNNKNRIKRLLSALKWDFYRKLYNKEPVLKINSLTKSS